MLKGVPKILSPDLLKILCEMGHTDTIVLGDGNFTGANFAKLGDCKFIRADGLSAVELLDAILEVTPLEEDIENPVMLMACDKDLDIKIWDEYKKVIAKHNDQVSVGFLERYDFYKQAKKAYCIVQTGEEAIYANVIIRKGVIE